MPLGESSTYTSGLQPANGSHSSYLWTIGMTTRKQSNCGEVSACEWSNSSVIGVNQGKFEWNNVKFSRNVHYYIHWEQDNFITANVITMNIKGMNDSPLSYFLPFPQHLFCSFNKLVWSQLRHQFSHEFKHHLRCYHGNLNCHFLLKGLPQNGFKWKRSTYWQYN